MPDGPMPSMIDRLSFTLDITTSMPEKRSPASRCLNRFEHENAVVVDITAQWPDNKDEDDNDEEEVDPGVNLEMLKKLPAFVGRELVLHTAHRDSETGVPDPDMELVDCIIEWEKIHRNAKTWRSCEFR